MRGSALRKLYLDSSGTLPTTTSLYTEATNVSMQERMDYRRISAQVATPISVSAISLRRFSRVRGCRTDLTTVFEIV